MSSFPVDTGNLHQIIRYLSKYFFATSAAVKLDAKVHNSSTKYIYLNALFTNLRISVDIYIKCIWLDMMHDALT